MYSDWDDDKSLFGFCRKYFSGFVSFGSSSVSDDPSGERGGDGRAIAVDIWAVSLISWWAWLATSFATGSIMSFFVAEAFAAAFNVVELGTCGHVTYVSLEGYFDLLIVYCWHQHLLSGSFRHFPDSAKTWMFYGYSRLLLMTPRSFVRPKYPVCQLNAFSWLPSFS